MRPPCGKESSNRLRAIAVAVVLAVAVAVAAAVALAACGGASGSGGSGSPGAGSPGSGPGAAGGATAPTAAGGGPAPAVEGRPRVSAWTGAVTPGGRSFRAETVRMVVHSTVAGGSLRLHFSNRYGSRPLVLGAVDVALRRGRGGGDAVPGSHRTARFPVRPGSASGGTRGAHVRTGGVSGGSASPAVTASPAATSVDVTIPAGGEAVTRPVPLHLAADHSLLVSVYLPNVTGPSTFHSDADGTSWTTGPGGGDHAAEDTTAHYPRTDAHWYYLDGVDLVPDHARDTVVAFGDSITDGTAATPGADLRWPDDLARRFTARPGGRPHAVVDAGIGGNRLLTDAPAPVHGAAGIRRFVPDALDLPGVRSVIVLEGVNDIGNDAGPRGRPLTASDLIAGLRRLIELAHARRVRVYGGTLTPFRGASYWTPRGERIREVVNHWIRTAHAFDGTVDFAAAVADPADPERMAPRYDSGDHLHPGSEGYRAMADAVDPREVAGG